MNDNIVAFKKREPKEEDGVSLALKLKHIIDFLTKYTPSRAGTREVGFMAVMAPHPVIADESFYEEYQNFISSFISAHIRAVVDELEVLDVDALTINTLGGMVINDSHEGLVTSPIPSITTFFKGAVSTLNFAAVGNTTPTYLLMGAWVDGRCLFEAAVVAYEQTKGIDLFDLTSLAPEVGATNEQ